MNVTKISGEEEEECAIHAERCRYIRLSLPELERFGDIGRQHLSAENAPNRSETEPACVSNDAKTDRDRFVERPSRDFNGMLDSFEIENGDAASSEAHPRILTAFALRSP